MSNGEVDLAPPSFEGNNCFESAVQMIEYFKGWIDWTNPSEIMHKTIWSALAVLSMYGLDRLLPDLCKFLASSVENIQESEIDIAKFQESYGHLRRETIHHLSAFICSPTLDKNMAKNGTDTYYHTLHTICILDSLLLHRPCCRLVSMAWLIPAIPAGVPAISLVAYAAEELADFANDPAGPLTFDCTRIGNSWLHRLGIFLLHQCQEQSIAPDPHLIRLMSLVSLPPSASVKSGKATRFSDYLASGDSPHYLHEAPPGQAVGTALALELLGEFDANRQGEHYRRIERAVAYYSHNLLLGAEVSVKGVHKASGLSWADAKELLSRPFFSRLVFEYQCRSLFMEPCPECEEVRRRLAEEADHSDPSLLRASASSW